MKDKLFFFGSYQGTRQLNGIGSNGFATSLTQVGLLPFNEPGVPFANARADGQRGHAFNSGLHPGGTPCNYNTYRQYLGCAFAGETDFASGLGQAGHFVLPTTDPTSVTPPSISCGRRRKFPRLREASTTAITFPACVTTRTDLPFLHRESTTPCCSTPTTISQATIANEDQYMLNADYVLNAKNTLSEKYFFSKDPQMQSFSCIVTGCYPGAPENAHYGSQSAVVRLTSVVTNNFVNDAFFSAQRLYLNVTGRRDGPVLRWRRHHAAQHHS